MVEERKEGESEFHLWSRTGNLALVCAALESGEQSDVDAKTSCQEGFTPLILASRFGNVEIVQTLLRHGAKAQPEGENKHYPLRAASIGGYLEICKLLVEAGADVNQPSQGNRTPLHGAVLNNHAHVVEWLLQQGADKSVVNDFGETAESIARDKEFQTCLALLEGE